MVQTHLLLNQTHAHAHTECILPYCISIHVKECEILILPGNSLDLVVTAPMYAGQHTLPYNMSFQCAAGWKNKVPGLGPHTGFTKDTQSSWQRRVQAGGSVALLGIVSVSTCLAHMLHSTRAIHLLFPGKEKLEHILP